MGNASISPEAFGHHAGPAPGTPENGILARVGGQYIGSGWRHLPAACAAEKDNPVRSVVMNVPNLGAVRILYRLNSYHHGRSRHWHWLAVRADQVDGAGEPPGLT